jgi:hypothetical protein
MLYALLDTNAPGIGIIEATDGLSCYCGRDILAQVKAGDEGGRIILPRILQYELIDPYRSLK